ncbi:energy-coupling factor transport system substrate-specific component [Mumia flava]|uniref:Energy-coupling factor transport system substrate-specific component n=1 Tax=Mumia flava TaxID=1348852 RepID=A0A0B2BVR7_9ACTN|nr:ECF transporter S component [Mumia flava]PJJ58069.1 energy-coupling factor transport system substrate-specific component [Mumia flava]
MTTSVRPDSTRFGAVPVGPRSVTVLVLATVAGLMMFAWPLLFTPAPGQQDAQAPLYFVLLLPVLLLVVVAELSEGGMDAKALAMLGVLSAIQCGLRALSAGTAGLDLVFFLLVLGGRVFGAGFGFVLGCTSMFASALLTAGVGPWLPFQMMCAAWIGMGAGLLPRRITGRAEIAMLAVYGVVSAYLYGALLNLWFWPFLAGIDPSGEQGIAFVPGASLAENLSRFFWFTMITSTASWDTGRAITNAVCIVLLGPAVLAILRRAARRASFDATPSFEAPVRAA